LSNKSHVIALPPSGARAVSDDHLPHAGEVKLEPQRRSGYHRFPASRGVTGIR
jgi:hypothetical protein